MTRAAKSHGSLSASPAPRRTKKGPPLRERPSLMKKMHCGRKQTTAGGAALIQSSMPA